MDFGLSDEQQAVFDTARRFGADRIAPHALEWDRAGTIPRALWAEAGELGFGGLAVPEELGGAGMGRVDTALVLEALAMACPSVAAFLSIHGMAARMIALHATPSLRARLLPSALAMTTILSYALTEPGAGSDAAAITTRAEPDGEGWRLTGTKAFISGGGYSDAYIVMARSGGPGARGISAFVVENGTPGLSFGGLERKMGWRAQETRALQLDGARVAPDAMLGNPGGGFGLAMSALDGGRVGIAACSLGAAQAAFDATRRYTAERHAFGQPLNQFQALQFRLADAAIGLQAARLMLRHAAWKLDTAAPDATAQVAMAKVLVTETAAQVVDDCLQLHGGYGYLEDYGIEKLARDLRVHRILEGTNEIMRLIIARGLTS